MLRIRFFFALLITGSFAYSQNDQDAIRYSRVGINGTSRFVGLGGAFGAIGADLGCAAYNPAGLGLYRKGEITFSGGLTTTNNQGIINSKTSSVSDAAFNFNNFGILTGWPAKNDKESRNIIAFTSTQVQNFLNKTQMSSYSTSSIVKDMYNRALQDGIPGNYNSSYEGLGYNVYLLDFDSASHKPVSFVDFKKAVLQSRSITTSGKVNDRNFSYAYAYKDQFYFGVSLGVPKVEYVSTTIHTEKDDKDSMKIVKNSDSTYSSTYSSPLPFFYTDKLGFNSLTYTEYFKTTGTGVNLKIGGIARLNDYVRVGMYYHTPTIYNLTDQYYNIMSASFDAKPAQPIQMQDPPDAGGYFKYKIVTPGRFSLNTAFIIKKMAVVGVDYEMVNYRTAALSSVDVADFAGANAVIKSKYKTGHNLRVGSELNIKPVMFRLGYNMQGSPFGNTFTGNFVRNSFSVGAGIRTKNNFYVDLVWVKTLSNEDYYYYNTTDPTLNSKALIKYSTVSLSATIGVKF